MICLLRPRAGEAFRFSALSLSLPLGLAYVAGALEAAGHEVVVLDAVALAPRRRRRYLKGWLVGLPDDELIARIPADATLVGITATFTHEWPSTARLIEAIRRARPGLRILIGGEHVTAMPEFSLLTSGADIAVLGEGEETAVELADGRPLPEIAGIAWRDGDRVHVNPRRARRRDVDAIAPPAWRHFDVAGYSALGFTGGVGAGRVTVPILATRGCPYQCSYCTNPFSWGTDWIARDAVAVVDEMERWQRELGAGNFPFQDLTAILRRDWIVRFCEELIARRLDVRWQMPTGTRVEAVDREVASLLARSGMIGTAFAPESGSEATRAAVKKKMSTESLLSGIAAAEGAGLNAAIFLVLGFPQDTHASLRENLGFVDRAVEAGASELSLGYFMALPGTELFESLFDAGRVRLDRRWFAHMLQGTELLPSISWSEDVGRAGLTWWTLRTYARFFLQRRRLSAREGSKLPMALRFAAVSAGHALGARLQRRWLPRDEERRLFAAWDELHRSLRRQQLDVRGEIAAPLYRNVAPLVTRRWAQRWSVVQAR